jgi:hypothetical protein
MGEFDGIDRGSDGRRGPDQWATWRQWSLICLGSITVCVVVTTCVLGYHYVRTMQAMADIAARMERFEKSRK